MAELMIRIVKNVLFKFMRFLKTKNWPSLLNEIEERLNKRHLDTLSGGTPSEFANPWNDATTIKRRKFVQEPKPYKEKEIYVVGEQVYITGKAKKFKPDWSKTGKTFTIVSIDNKEKPILYKLRDDETNQILHGKFYSKQLARVPITEKK